MKDKIDGKPVKKKIGQIQQQGKDMHEIVSKYEVPQEFHAALWAAYEAGAEMGFWKAIEAETGVDPAPGYPIKAKLQKGDIDDNSTR